MFGWSLSTPTIKRQTSLLNLLMVHGLNHFVRLLVLVSSLDSYLLCDLPLFSGASLSYRSHMNVSFTSFCLLFLLILLCFFYFWVCWKIQILIKSEKFQKVWSIVLCISHVRLAQYLHTNGVVHLRA